MRGVPIKSLGEVAESVRYGYTASATDESGGPHFLRITDIVPPQIDWTSVPYCKIDERDIPNSRSHLGTSWLRGRLAMRNYSAIPTPIPYSRPIWCAFVLIRSRLRWPDCRVQCLQAIRPFQGRGCRAAERKCEGVVGISASNPRSRRCPTAHHHHPLRLRRPYRDQQE